MKRYWIICTVSIMTIITFLISIVLPFLQSTSAANDTILNIDYDFVVDSNDYEYSGYLFSAKKELETKKITFNAPQGKIIKKLEWIDKKTNTPLRSIKGFTPGSTTWSGKDTLSGNKIKSIFY